MRVKPLSGLAVAAALFFLPSLAFAEVVSEQWMEVKMMGSKIGFTYQKTEKTKDGYRITSRANIRLRLPETTQEISTSQTLNLDKDKNPVNFAYMQKMLNHRQFFEGVIKGDTVEVTVTSGGNVSKRTVPYAAGAEMADALNIALGEKELKTGDVYEMDVFLIPMLSSATIRVEIGKRFPFPWRGEKVDVFIVNFDYKDFKVTSYITPEGRVIKEESPMGFISMAAPEEEAVSFDDDIMPFTNLLTFSLIKTQTPITGQEALTSLTLRMSGLDDDRGLPESGRQKVLKTEKNKSGDHSLTVKIQKDALPADIPSLPIRGKAMEPYLAPTIEAQADDPAIIKKAAQIVGLEKNAWKAAKKINRWVYDNVEKKFVDTFSAVATLNSLEGECQSHTNLFTALARARGIPVRTNSGIVYSRDFDGFLYHAWPEVYVGEWVAMDPTFGQDIADATHVKLAEGELSQQLQLFRFLGKISLDVIEEERE